MIKKLVDYFINIWCSNLYDKSKFHELLLMKKLFTPISFLRACEGGNLELVKFLFYNKIQHNYGIESAVMHGNFIIAKYLFEKLNMKLPTSILNTLLIYSDDIVYSGKDPILILDMLQYLFENGGTYTDDLLLDARHCSYDIIKFIINEIPESYNDGDLFFLLEDVPFCDKPYIVSLLVHNGFIITSDAINENCRRNNYYNVCKMLSFSNCVDELTLDAAITSGNIRLVKKILSIDSPLIKENKIKGLYTAQKNHFIEIQNFYIKALKMI